MLGFAAVAAGLGGSPGEEEADHSHARHERQNDNGHGPIGPALVRQWFCEYSRRRMKHGHTVGFDIILELSPGLACTIGKQLLAARALNALSRLKGVREDY